MAKTKVFTKPKSGKKAARKAQTNGKARQIRLQVTRVAPPESTPEPQPEAKPDWELAAEKREAAEKVPVTITTKQLVDLMGADTTCYEPLNIMAHSMEDAARMLEILGDASGADSLSDDFNMLCIVEARRLRATADICADLDRPEPVVP